MLHELSHLYVMKVAQNLLPREPNGICSLPHYKAHLARETPPRFMLILRETTLALDNEAISE